MSKRVIAAVGLAAATAAAVAGAVPAASANPGPPPPVAHNGHTVHLVASNLKLPTSFAFGGGHVFVGDAGNSEGSAPPNGGVYVIENGVAHKFLTSYKFVAGLAWHDNKLYISGGQLTSKGVAWRLSAWGGWNGKTFATRHTLYTAPKGFQGFNGIGFGANGRLYVGVDVGLLNGNDHGPATTSPYVYDILTFKADGSDRRVYATGIRQPWQMAFAPGSNAPYVTDLGQDAGATNPPDFILHVWGHQNYGFPKCNWTSATACKGYSRPANMYSPHVDLMGIALHGQTQYLTSFAGWSGQGPGGEVFSKKISRHTLMPLITGFVAPTVGLAYHGGWLYVGELTGQVFRLWVG